jgi:hypothetical protein
MACCYASCAMACWNWSPKRIPTSRFLPHDRHHDWPPLVARFPVGHLTTVPTHVDRMWLFLLLRQDEQPITQAFVCLQLSSGPITQSHYRLRFGRCVTFTPRAISCVPVTIVCKRVRRLGLPNYLVYRVYAFHVSRYLTGQRGPLRSTV